MLGILSCGFLTYSEYSGCVVGLANLKIVLRDFNIPEKTMENQRERGPQVEEISVISRLFECASVTCCVLSDLFDGLFHPGSIHQIRSMRLPPLESLRCMSAARESAGRGFSGDTLRAY